MIVGLQQSVQISVFDDDHCDTTGTTPDNDNVCITFSVDFVLHPLA